MSADTDHGPTIKYAVLENGDITRTDKDSTLTVAMLKEGDVLVLDPQWEQFRPAIVRYLNSIERMPTAIYIEGEEPPQKGSGKKDIPPMPKKMMALGDKTPAVVEWYKKYHPAQYKARYGISGPGTVTKWREKMNEKGEKVRESYEVDAILATRKIHLTEKIEANEAQQSEYADGQ